MQCLGPDLLRASSTFTIPHPSLPLFILSLKGLWAPFASLSFRLCCCRLPWWCPPALTHTHTCTSIYMHPCEHWCLSSLCYYSCTLSIYKSDNFLESIYIIHHCFITDTVSHRKKNAKEKVSCGLDTVSTTLQPQVYYSTVRCPTVDIPWSCFFNTNI